MSIVFSKNKEKRSRSSSSEANNSFVKNVTSRVSGLLPATITKWFSSPRSNANGSAQTADATDSSTEDEAPESPITSQPPTKRMRFSSPGSYNQFGTSNTNCATTSIDTVDHSPYSTVQSPPGRTTFRRETNYVSTPLRSPGDDVTTDGREKDTTMFKPQHSVSAIGSSVATKRKSLFDSTAASEASLRACAKITGNQPRDPKQPCFKPSLLGSPFYPGRTMYGGASAYINQPNIQIRKNTVVKESSTNNDNTISHSARRIMDLLESYSSPVNEARRIAPYLPHPRHISPNNSYEGSSPYGNKVRSYKTQELHVPSLASILRLKQRSRLMDTTNAARQIIASHSSTTGYMPYISRSTQRDQTETDSNNKLTTKVKTRVTRPKRGEADLETNVPTPVTLPSAVLQIDQDNLPKFSFGTPKVSSQAPCSTSTPIAAFTKIDDSTKVKESITVNKITDTPIRKPEVSSNLYKFASPVRISSGSFQLTTTPPKFTFGSPDRNIDKIRTHEINVAESSCVVGTSKTDTDKTVMSVPKDSKCPDTSSNLYKFASPVRISSESSQITTTLPKFTFGSPDRSIDKMKTKDNKDADPPCVLGTSKADTDKTVMSVPKDSKCPDESSKLYKFASPVRITSDSFQLTTTPPKFTFGSPDRNIDKMRTNAINVADPSCVVGTSKADTDKTVTSVPKDWKCPDCWVNNKTDVDKCVCCGGKKPSSDKDKPAKCSVCKLADSQSHVDKCANCEKVKVNNIMTPATKPDPSKWECKDCWIRNNEADDKCICCGAGNPKKSAAQTNAVSNDTSSEWRCDDCWVKNKSTVDACVACGGKPGAKPAAATGFSLFNTPKPPDGAIKNIVGTQNSKWECTSCLVRNDNDKLRCACCEAQRPGTLKETEKKSFNFGMNASTFKFGIDPKAQEATNNATEVKTTTDTKAKVEESETNNNVLAKAPTFSFGTPKKLEDQTDSAKKVEEKPVDSAPKMNFTFGVPAGVPSVTTTTTPVFGTPSKPAEPVPKTKEDENEKLQEVPIVNFGIPKTQEMPKPNSNLFTPPTTTKDKPAEASPLVNTFKFNTEKKESPANSLTLNAVVSLPEASPKTTSFSFTGTSIKPAANLFGSPSTTAATNTFASPVQTTVTSTVTLFSKPEPTTTAMSMFQKPDAAKPTVSLFQKSDSQTTTASPPSLGATAPMFSFGGGTQVAAPQNEKPKFNFTFGSNNKTEAPSLFKPTFGAPNDTSSTNKFSLPTGNATMTGGNGANVLSGNLTTTIGGNELNNSLTTTNNLQTNAATPNTGLFGAVQKENMWSNNSSATNNLFVSSVTTNSLQKPAAFTFGSQFSASGSTTFGNGAQSSPVFGMGSQSSTTQPSMFSSPVQSPPSGGMFSQPASNPAPAMGMFGTPSVGAAPTFGTPNASIPPFEAPSLTPAPAPAFNFGAPQSTGIFGFGQQQAQVQPQSQQAGLYSFGGAPAAGAVQFNMGSAPNPGRRVRKAVRRNTPR